MEISLPPPGMIRDQIPDLAGRVFVVTGASRGLGRVTASLLARAGATVVAACRCATAAMGAIATVESRSTSTRINLVPLDLADLQSVSEFAELTARRFPRLDGVINNAGIMGVPTRHVTKDGFELQFGTNHLGHFALMALLFPRMNSGARVVSVTSINAKIGEIDFDDLHSRFKYDPWKAYSASKLANLAFAMTFDRRLRSAGRDIVSVAAHPGVALTNLFVTGPTLDGPSEYADQLKNEITTYAQSESDGALSIFWAATSVCVQSGDLVGPDGIDQMRGNPTVLVPYQRGIEPQVGDRLWAASEELTGREFVI